MKMLLNIKNRVSWQIVTVLFVIINSLVLFSCASVGTGAGAHGALKPSREVKEMFESYTVLPDHTYYYSGSSGRPRVVMGLHNDYQLQSGLWKKADLTPKKLNGWINFGRTRAGFDQRPNGFYIVDANQKQIGVWYALIDWRDTTVIKTGDGNQVTVYTPIQPQDKPGKFNMFFK